jgi:23S rRNA (guanosine2251-2'-O)-methyltransferase
MSLIITGKNTVMEAIKTNRKIHELYIQKGTNKEVFSFVNDKNIKIVELDKQKMNEVCLKNHQGLGAKIDDYKYLTIEDALAKPKENKVFVMLDQLEDPHNLGAILRSADAFSIDGIIIPKNRSVQLTSTVAKVSTGAIEHVDVISVTNLTQTIKTLKEHGFWIAGTDMDTEQTIHNINVDTDLCIVIGNEGKGISRLVKQNCDYIVKIPMSGHVNSLNASVSTAIVLYEVFKKKGD